MQIESKARPYITDSIQFIFQGMRGLSKFMNGDWKTDLKFIEELSNKTINNIFSVFHSASEAFQEVDLLHLSRSYQIIYSIAALAILNSITGCYSQSPTPTPELTHILPERFKSPSPTPYKIPTPTDMQYDFGLQVMKTIMGRKPISILKNCEITFGPGTIFSLSPNGTIQVIITDVISPPRKPLLSLNRLGFFFFSMRTDAEPTHVSNRAIITNPMLLQIPSTKDKTDLMLGAIPRDHLNLPDIIFTFLNNSAIIDRSGCSETNYIRLQQIKDGQLIFIDGNGVVVNNAMFIEFSYKSN